MTELRTRQIAHFVFELDVVSESVIKIDMRCFNGALPGSPKADVGDIDFSVALRRRAGIIADERRSALTQCPAAEHQ